MNNKNPVQLLGKWLLNTVFLLILMNSARAEDTAIFADEIPPAQPNILFLLDQSGSMGIQIEGTTQTRADALKFAFDTVMSDPDLVEIDVGLIGFSSGESTPYAHGVSFPISPIDGDAHQIMLSNLLPFGSSSATTVGYFSPADDILPDTTPAEPVRSYLPRILSSWNIWGGTPIVDSYHEAALYFRGERPKWGLAAPNQNHAAHPSTYKGSSVGTVSEVATGNTAICDAPDCGINCTGYTEQSACAVGNLSCGLGTNCSTATESWGENCTLGTEAECMASDPKYTSCTATSNASCSTSCVNGVYHPETGLCIPDALNSFTIKTHEPNMCLEVNGQALTQELCDGSAEQVFYTTNASPGFVQIRASNNFCFDVAGGSNADGASIGAYPCQTTFPAHQAFLPKSTGEIVAAGSSKCMEVPDSSPFTSPFTSPFNFVTAGVAIQQSSCTGNANQVFIMSNEATSCATTSDILCQYPQETTRCDHQKYSCDETTDNASLNSNDIVYNSPITDKCETNAIVVLSDGEPWNTDQAQLNQTMAEIKSMAGLTADCAGASDDAGRCGVELARFLATKDQSSDIEGDNVINTYTIGFDVSAGSIAETFLTSVAKAGDGKYFPASNAAALAAVFKAIISDVSKTARSYAAPVYTVDPSSRLAHSRNIYIPLFENSSAPRWAGNLKKFKLNDAGQIIDKAGKVAVSADGILDPEAADFWSNATVTTSRGKPNPVTSGGAANLLDPATRNLLTDNGNTLVALNSSSVTKQALTGSGNLSDDLHESLIKFIRGYDNEGNSRKHFGDILHSKPTVVSYADKEVIFFGTNEGYIHAINTADADTTGGGKELFAYMPSPLLSNIQGQYKNKPLTGPIKRIYGVDGEMTVWINDKDKNGKVDSGESVYLYFGLRRGGSAYYALDITKPSEPKLLWTINNTSGFSKLGQTWSKPAMGKLRYKDSGAIKFEEVLVFGGGYDASVYDEEDAASRVTTNVRGNGIYIVNATTGKLIWSHEGGDLKDSVPSNIRVMDVDRNGSLDRLYFGDTGGNVWRVDLNIDDFDDDASMHDVKNDARIYKFAELGNNTGSDFRKFFYEPEVSTFKHKGRFVSLVTIGSGYRAHPKNDKIKDSMFILYDENTLNIPETVPPPLTATDLASSAALAGDDFLPTYKGWHRPLSHTGEKVLSPPLVFMDKVMFTTFASTTQPVETGGIGSCTTKTNNFSRAYVLDLMTGAATADLDGDGKITSTDESIITGSGDIPDSPTLVFNEPNNCTSDGCDHIVDIRVGKLEKPLIDGSTLGGNTNLGEYLPKVFWVDR